MAPFADAHMHLFMHSYHPRRDAHPGGDVARYEAIMQAHAITAALAVGYEGEGIDPDNNAYLRSLAAQRPWMSTVAHLPVAPAPTSDRLEKRGGGGVVGGPLRGGGMGEGGEVRRGTEGRGEEMGRGGAGGGGDGEGGGGRGEGVSGGGEGGGWGRGGERGERAGGGGGAGRGRGRKRR